jgi:PTS system ascorbate-specific IIC component
MLAAFVGNILVARFTKFKSIYLTGNLLIWFPMLFISVAVEAGMTNQVALFFFAFILDMALITISPQLMRPLVKKLTGSEDFTIGHTTAPFCLMGAGIGKLINKPEESTEDLNIPKSLDFLRSTTITSGLVMITLYYVLAIILFATGRGDVVINSGLGQYWYTAAIMQGLTFAAGTVVLLHGVRMMLAEIVPAFKGISDKFVPGAIPALDIPLVFPYGQNALMIGFIISMITSVATIFIMGSLGWLNVVVIPLTVACFFDVAPAAIFANKYGGRKAAYLTAALGGILMIVLVAFTIPMIANTTGTFLQLYGGNEFSLWTAIAQFFANIFA